MKLAWGLWTFGNGAADIAAGMLTRASDAFMLEGMTEEERNAYIFSPLCMAYIRRVHLLI